MEKSTAIKKDSNAVKIENLPAPSLKPTPEDLDSIQVLQVLTPKSNASRNLKFSFIGTVIGVIVFTITSLGYPSVMSHITPRQAPWLTNPLIKLVGQSLFFAITMFVVLFTSASVRAWIASRSA